MRISAISNNQFKAINNNNKQNKNVSFSGVKEFLNKDIRTVLNKPVSQEACVLVLATTAVLGGVGATLLAISEKKEAINKIGNFINSENYNKDALEVKDFTNDGVLDFELTDKDGNKIVYDAKEDQLLAP